MGDYAVTQVVLKVKKEVLPLLEKFHIEEKELDEFPSTMSYDKFWKSVGVTSFENSYDPFGTGSFHAYKTSLGDSDSRMDSYFYQEKYYVTRLEGGLWFVFFGSKVNAHRQFIDKVVPKIADSWVGLYGDEYSKYPSEESQNPEEVVSTSKKAMQYLTLFRNEISLYKEEERVEKENNTYSWGYTRTY